MIFTLEALAAREGDCLLLHYGATHDPLYILIDGGPAGVYRSTLRPRLLELQKDGAPVPLQLAMVSHIDADHITGMLDLFKELNELRNSGLAGAFEIGTLWHNGFQELVEATNASFTAQPAAAVAASVTTGTVPAGASERLAAVAASVKQGSDLRQHATQLNVPINKFVKTPLVQAAAVGKTRVKLAGGLTLTILGPHQAEIDRLEREWRRAEADGRASSAAFAADYLNRTASNLSSIVTLAQFRTTRTRSRRILLTGDAGGDLMMKALESAGLLKPDKPLTIDLLKVQHHGSRHSVDIEFFRRVVARRYLISGDGKHENPHIDTLTWLSQARTKRTYDVYLTYREGKGGLSEKLADFLEQERVTEPRHHYHFREPDAASISVRLAD